MSFFVYDVIFLILASIVIAGFIWKNKKKIKREGVVFLYRTMLGVKLIEHISKKYKRTLSFLEYIIIPISYILMVGMLYLFGKTIYGYIFDSALIELIGKSPPVAPVIPYFTKLFGFEQIFPPFYFVYFLVALAIVAIVHELSHGIFMRHNKIKIKSTGLAFLGPFLGAFVEQDEKDMNNSKKIKQMGVLGAGVFANLFFAVMFLVILSLFFSFAFTPLGVVFSSYAYSSVDVSSISMINEMDVNGISYDGLLSFSGSEYPLKIKTSDKTYLVTKDLLEISANRRLFEQRSQIVLYDDAPAINAGLIGAIKDINGIKINNFEKLQQELNKYSPGEKINIETTEGVYDIVLEENPKNNDKGWIGISFISQDRFINKYITHFLTSTRPSSLYLFENVSYAPKFGGVSEFVYYLIWWIVMINFLVALFNMLPLGILDGGRFFYLTVWGITGKESAGKKAYKLVTYLILSMIFLITTIWIFRLFG